MANWRHVRDGRGGEGEEEGEVAGGEGGAAGGEGEAAGGEGEGEKEGKSE